MKTKSIFNGYRNRPHYTSIYKQICFHRGYLFNFLKTVECFSFTDRASQGNLSCIQPCVMHLEWVYCLITFLYIINDQCYFLKEQSHKVICQRIKLFPHGCFSNLVMFLYGQASTNKSWSHTFTWILFLYYWIFLCNRFSPCSPDWPQSPKYEDQTHATMLSTDKKSFLKKNLWVCLFLFTNMAKKEYVWF